MSMDLTEATEAGARAAWEDWRERRGAENVLPAWEDADAITRHNLREAQLPTVAAAAEVIEAQVREQVAREIERERWGGRKNRRSDTTDCAYERAVRIARGEG